MPTNQLGLAFTAANDDAVGAIDRSIDEYLGMGRDTGRYLKDALTADPAMVMGLVLRGYFFKLMGLPALLPRAGQALEAARAKSDAATQRERLHVSALAAWCAGDFEGAIAAWEAILRDFPHDVLALRLASHLYFYLGDSAGIRDSVARVMPAWDAAMPGYAYLLGIHAFGLEETGDYRAAEKSGRTAVELNPRDRWAVHAVAHVMDSEERYAEGLEWLEALEPHWSGAHNFRYHLLWHRALMHLGRGEHEQALALYDERLWDPESDEYLDLCNDASLLARLELAGVDVGDRWQAVADKVDKQVDTRVLAFVDAHYVLALAAAGRSERVAQVLQAIGRYAADSRETTARVTAEVGSTLCEALVAWRAQDFERVVAALTPVRAKMSRIGGSHAQRDLITQVLTASANAAGRTDVARAILTAKRKKGG